MNCMMPCRPLQKGAPFKPHRKITIATNDEKTPKNFDFLVIACDPQEDGLKEEVMKRTKKEKAIFSLEVMKSFVFQTTLIKFPKVDGIQIPTAISVFNPANLNASKGLLHSYRSETRKEALTLAYASNTDNPKAYFKEKMDEAQYEYVTIYQLVDPAKENGKLTETQLWTLLQSEMNSVENKRWFPYDWTKGEKIKQFHTKYFDHFTREALSNKTSNNWSLLDIQGKKNTIYVHAATAFESVLHIYEYVELLQRACPSSFPIEKQSRIAVVGAGPSGLLISRKLVQMGYTDITVYESKGNESDLYAGKTQTNMIHQLNTNIPAELGTCYLSPSYNNMMDDFKKSKLLTSGQKLISIDQIDNGPIVKRIITIDQFEHDGPILTLFRTDPGTLELDSDVLFPYNMDFEVYQTLKGFEEVYKGKNLSVDKLKEKYGGFKIEIAQAAIRYIIYHKKHYGRSNPFPKTQRRVKSEIFSLDIHDFLQKNNFMSLFGILQYGYSVQGYGSTELGGNVSAFYLLMWVTPELIVTFIKNEVKELVIKGLDKINIPNSERLGTIGKKDPLVQALSKGWGDVWKTLKLQFSDEDKVHIKYGANITNITRDNLE